MSLALSKFVFHHSHSWKETQGCHHKIVSDFGFLSPLFPGCRNPGIRFGQTLWAPLCTCTMLSAVIAQADWIKASARVLLRLWLDLNHNVNRLQATKHLRGATPPLPSCKNLCSHSPIHRSLTFHKPFKLRIPFVWISRTYLGFSNVKTSL